MMAINIIKSSEEKKKADLRLRSLLQVYNICKDILLTDEQLIEIMNLFLQEVDRGLGRETHSSATVKCYNTHIHGLPRGKERGKYLALNVGGTHFRIIVIHLEDKRFDMQCKKYSIRKTMLHAKGNEFFDYIAECLESFISEFKLNELLPLPLGLTFSFPLKQKSLSEAVLLRWTKGFNVSDVIGKDVAALLKGAIKRKNIDVEVCAVINDTTGTLLACSWANHNCFIGLVVGNGSNICYVEDIDKVETYEGDEEHKYVVINVESGAFGDGGELNPIRTAYDYDIDKYSLNAGKQILEKMVSAFYLGELVQNILIELVNKKQILGGRGSEFLFQRGNFYTNYIYEILSEKEDMYTICKEIMSELRLFHATEVDCAILRFICSCVSKRSAALVSAVTAALINRMNFEDVTVACDGQLFREHPMYLHLVTDYVRLLINQDKKFELMVSEDGCGRGAALVAAVVTEQKKKKTNGRSLCFSSTFFQTIEQQLN